MVSTVLSICVIIGFSPSQYKYGGKMEGGGKFDGRAFNLKIPQAIF